MSELEKMAEFISDESGGKIISTEQLDDLIREMKRLDDEKDKAKQAHSEASEKYEAARDAVLSALKACGKSKYYVDGLGTAFIASRLSFQTPKEIEQKDAFFNWIASTFGDDTLKGMVTVNSQTLNAFCKREFEAALERGEADFKIPGINEPTAQETVNFRKG